jgi:2'-5' RNA ligase
VRLFVAVWPPAEIVEQVAALPRPDVRGLRWTPSHHWHVTLRFLGSVESAEPVEAALSTVRCGPLDVTVGPAVGRFGHRILHVPVTGLEALAEAVVAATRHLGEPPEERVFTGHLTLARAERRARTDLRPVTGTPIAGSWTVGEMTLVESRGGRYEVLASFPLGG